MAIQLIVAIGSDIGRVRSRNEDSFLVADVVGGRPTFESDVARFAVGPRGALLAVSDGMGGHRAGHVASAMTLDALYRALVERASNPNLAARLEQAAAQASAEVHAVGRRDAFANMGATVTAILVEGEAAHVASVGDSRAYVVRGREMHRLTRDQSVAQIAADAGAIAPDEVAASPLRHVLVQAMGHTLDLRVELTRLLLRQHDCIVLATDGLTQKLSDEEIRDRVLATPSLAAACRVLIDEANARGGEDNVTVILAKVAGTVPPVQAGEHFASTYAVLRAFEPR
jgi:serine/threonine protein phosphatase PrpC